MRTVFACMAVGALVLSGCATRTSDEAHMAISAADYSSLSCEDARAELTEARARKNVLSRRYSVAEMSDANSASRTLVSRGSSSNLTVAGELAQAEGEVGALEDTLRSRCNA